MNFAFLYFFFYFLTFHFLDSFDGQRSIMALKYSINIAKKKDFGSSFCLEFLGEKILEFFDARNIAHRRMAV